jgi:hypothetical protein
MIQHFVPKVYLKNFAVQIREDYFIDVYDKNENRFFNTNIKNICSEKDLYTLDDQSIISKDKLVFEKFFSQSIEPMYQKCFNILTNDNICKINHQQRIELLLGIFQLYSRNPNLFKEIIDNDRLNITRLYEKAIKDEQRIILYRSTEFDLAQNTLGSIIQSIENQTLTFFKEKHVQGLSEIGTAHEDIIFHVSKIRDSSSFISGDNPMPFEDNLSQSIHPLLISKEFFLTLNPNYCIHLFHDKLKDPYTIIRSDIPNGSVATINEKVFKQSRRFITGTKRSIEEYFVMAKRMENLTESEAMDLMAEALQLGPHPTEPDYRGALPEVLAHFLSLYRKNGKLTIEQIYRLKRLMKRFSSEAIKKRLT